MANVQRYLEQFDEAIRMGRFDESAVLREKRDRVLKRLKEELPKLFEDKGEKAPKYQTLNQGSYEMGTGTLPVNGDYDIDVGILFSIAKADFADPVKVKEWVQKALAGHTKKVEIRRNCVTVWYQQEGEPIYHVDLAIYSDASSNLDGKTYLGRGKQNSSTENKFWEEADPRGLLDLIKECQQNPEDAKQFRRTVRYLKRWRDVKFPSTGNAAPVGIGITVAAYRWFAPVKSITDGFSNTAKYDDLEAIRQFAKAMVDRFQTVYSNGKWVDRLIVTLPVAPSGDVLTKMTDIQMADFKERLKTLGEVIDAAKGEADPVEACKNLQGQFGPDFPVPPKGETGQKRGPAFISSSTSA